jgi:hypothetical protein
MLLVLYSDMEELVVLYKYFAPSHKKSALSLNQIDFLCFSINLWQSANPRVSMGVNKAKQAITQAC